MTEESRSRSARRRRWSFALVVVGSILTLFSTVNTWVERQALNTDSWVSATDELLADDDVREALGIYLVDQLYAAIDVGDAFGELLPEGFDRLGGVLAGAIREPATDAVAGVLASDALQDAWSEANRAAHEALLAVIEDETGELLSTTDGVVSIDLRQLVVAVGERVGLSGAVLDRLPEHTGVLVLLDSEELEVVQDGARLVERLSALLFILVIGLFAAAVAVSPDRRRTVRDCGLGILAVGLLALVVRAIGTEALADRVSDAADREPALSILRIGSSLLRQVAVTEVLIGVLVIAFASLAGPSSSARRVRALLAPTLDHGAPVALVGGMIVFFLLAWIKPGGPIDGFLVALCIAGLCIAGVAWIQRVAGAESSSRSPTS